MAVGGRNKKVYSKKIIRLRRAILALVAAACLIPTCFCVILSIRYDRLNAKYEQSIADLDWYRQKYGDELSIVFSEENGGNKTADAKEDINAETGGFEQDYAEVDSSGEQSPEDIEGTRYVYLTFDDGPSIYTDEILDILQEFDVKATFFVCGKPDSKYVDFYKRIVEDGHTLGMHSYSHKYSDIYSSREAFEEDFKKLRVFLYETTGVWAKYYRFPGGSSNGVSHVDIKELESFLEESDVTFYDWNISAKDDKAGNTKESIYANIVDNVPKFKHCIVLMHDAADKRSTVDALPDVIKAIKAMDDTVIVPITDNTLPVQHIK